MDGQSRSQALFNFLNSASELQFSLSPEKLPVCPEATIGVFKTFGPTWFCPGALCGPQGAASEGDAIRETAPETQI